MILNTVVIKTIQMHALTYQNIGGRQTNRKKNIIQTNNLVSIMILVLVQAIKPHICLPQNPDMGERQPI